MRNWKERLTGLAGGCRPHWKATALLMVVIMMMAVVTVYAVTIRQVIICYDGNRLDIRTIRTTVGEVLKDFDVPIGEHDRVEPGLDDELAYSTTVTVYRAVRATITEGGQTREIMTAAPTAKDALAEYGVFLNEHDMLSCRLEDPVTEGMDLLVTRVTLDYYEENVVLPYQTETRDNDQLPWGTVNVLQTGANGVMVRGTQVMYCDGVEQHREVIKEEYVRDPVTEILERGTDNAHVTASGDIICYKKVLTCTATAYDPSHQSPSSPYYGLTASGTRARVGSVAVDPRVIPLGSKLYIESPDGSWCYGFSTAEDTGGAIKGNKIDLFYNSRSEALRFGRRQATVYVLE